VPKKLSLEERADGTVKVATALVHRVPLPPQAVLTLFPDFTVEAEDPNFLKVHSRSTDPKIAHPSGSLVHHSLA